MTVSDEIDNVREQLREVTETGDVYSKGVRMTEDGVDLTVDLIDQGNEYEVYATAQSYDDGDSELVLQQIRNRFATDEDSDRPIHNSDKVDWMEVRFEADGSRF